MSDRARALSTQTRVSENMTRGLTPCNCFCKTLKSGGAGRSQLKFDTILVVCVTRRLGHIELHSNWGKLQSQAAQSARKENPMERTRIDL